MTLESHIMRMGTPHITSLKRTLATLEAVIDSAGNQTVADIARNLDIPVATAHRQVATLLAERYLSKLENGRHVAGPRLLRLLGQVDQKQIIASAAAPVLHRLAAQVKTTVQLGTFENDMVTYRIKTGQGAGELFTKVGMQLEAYCSGIGKVLLAELPADERENYLANGPFVPLTARTIVRPDALRAELEKVRRDGHAIDNGEVAEGLYCIAVPVRSPEGQVQAAISVSRSLSDAAQQGDEALLALLHQAAADVEAALPRE